MSAHVDTKSKFNISIKRYFERMNRMDLQARSCASSADCHSTYIQNLRPPTRHEAQIIEHATLAANKLLQPYKLLHDLPWKFLVTNDIIESGLPHTHHDIIILPKSHIQSAQRMIGQLVDTIVHEKVHVFQRFKPCVANTLYHNYWKFGIVSYLHATPHGVRTNPDTNELIYKDESGSHITAAYSDKTNPSLGEIKGDLRDHPHEMMAYIVTHIITSGKSHLNGLLRRYVDSTKEWMQSYLVG